ncbi:MAG: 2-phospho-L-lactate transferase [Acidimicrobiales bacterium]
MIATLAGGVGAARMLGGLSAVMAPKDILAIVNVADDAVMHGLHISPDLDTVTYTLAGAINPDTGWGLANETWTAMEALGRYAGQTWFRLGDKDLATHMYRTQRLDQGVSLAEVTAEITASWGLEVRIVPMSNDPVRTMVSVADETIGGEPVEIDFQDYFVRRRHAVKVSSLRFAGAAEARPSPGVLEGLARAEVIVICPSNPLVSIGPILAVPGMAATVASRREATVAVSPIVAGMAIKGPADRLLTELGHQASVVGVARLYAGLARVLVIDEADAHLAPQVEAQGMECIVTPTVMSSPKRAARLAATVLAAARGEAVTSGPA